MSRYFNFNFKLSFLLLLFLSLNVTKVIECSSTDPMDAIPFLNLPRDHFRSSWGSFWGRDHFRSSWGSFRVQLGGIISGLGIISGPVWGIISGLGIISGPVQICICFIVHCSCFRTRTLIILDVGTPTEVVLKHAWLHWTKRSIVSSDARQMSRWLLAIKCSVEYKSTIPETVI